MDWKNQPKSFWQSRLGKLQYEVTREGATERAYTGEYWDNKEAGSYECICCGTTLFDSNTKFESFCGWPSFSKAQEEKSIEEKPDNSMAMKRTEVRCKTCDAHLGHVFPDGPPPTGLRY